MVEALGEIKPIITNNIESINGSDISLEMPGIGETEIIMQRHEKYIRDINDPNTGSLEEEARKKAREQTKEILRSKFQAIPREDLKNLAILVIASNTRYHGGGMRSMETASEVINGISDIFTEFGLDENQLLNTRARVEGENIRPSKNKTIQEPRMLDESPEFVGYLKEKYGNMTQLFWQAFEEDWEKEEREKTGAEGPEGILKRYTKFIEILKNFSGQYHLKNPNTRLIIWPVSHYDTISPYIKNNILKTDPNKYLPVDYGAGISLYIDKEGNMTSEIQGNKFEI
jgi:hypothetical protein